MEMCNISVHFISDTLSLPYRASLKAEQMEQLLQHPNWWYKTGVSYSITTHILYHCGSTENIKLFKISCSILDSSHEKIK
jgi:hypothetical protein